ncbi:MAG: tRNA threonylcarbamoyladenosine dehydratase [Bacteroidia bacterium]|jgi:tRNA A37 threonylcarbamoyladenosine dehydratase|nr:tRNA threonylcarbamoyladenosine dehydratase [Bacteroidia bacterium]
MERWDIRTELALGRERLERLEKSHVLVAGLGGVGAFAAEMLVRAGIGSLTIVDGDKVHASNRNRQLPALVSTEGKAKTEVMEQRLLDINPQLKLEVINAYIKDQPLIDLLERRKYDFVVDAIDTLAPKVYLLYFAHKFGLKVVSSMGAGGKFDPTQVQIADFNDTHTCRLAYYIRKKLHKLGVREGITAVFSPEVVSKTTVRELEGEMNKKSTVGTISYMPATFGICCASVVIRHIAGL